MHTACDDPLISALQYAELSSITRDSFAFYGQGTYKLTDRLSITAGLRYNRDKYVGESDSISGGRSSQTSGSISSPVRPALPISVMR
jgi:iron complex outermembrane receptor protein